MNPIGVHFIPVHTGRHHYDFIVDMQPGVMKVVGSGFPDVQLLVDAYQSAPNARHVWRDHALSEQHLDLWNNPAATGARHAEEMSNHAENRFWQAAARGLALPERHVMLLGVNEPVIELFARNEDMSNYDEWLRMTKERAAMLDRYMVEFGRGCNKRGYSAGLGNFSSGQPANIRPGAYPTFAYWFPLTAQFLESPASQIAENALVVHEYWRAETGPGGWWDWHTCRFKHLDVDCDIFVLECGVDQLITDEDWRGNRGWQGHMPAAAYADQMRTYIERCRQDSRFRCATPFTLDGAKEWESFYIEPAMPEFIALSKELRADTPSWPDQPDPPPILSPGPQPVQPPAQATPTGILDPRVLLAIMEVESAAGFIDGRMVIRFEAHVFQRRLNDAEWFHRHFSYGNPPWTDQKMFRNGAWQPIHTGSQDTEYQALELAFRRNRTAALQSISMGRAQILGDNYARIGYATPEAMYRAFKNPKTGAEAQVIGMINYMLSDPALVAAVKAKDWRTIAAKYNGPGNVDVYAPLLQAAYEQDDLIRIADRPVLG